jgi:hypothetical protein
VDVSVKLFLLENTTAVKSPCSEIYGMNVGLCVVFVGMVLNIMKGLCGGHSPSEGNVITDTLVQQFSSKSMTHGNHHK